MNTFSTSEVHWGGKNITPYEILLYVQHNSLFKNIFGFLQSHNIPLSVTAKKKKVLHCIFGFLVQGKDCSQGGLFHQHENLLFQKTMACEAYRKHLDINRQSLAWNCPTHTHTQRSGEAVLLRCFACVYMNRYIQCFCIKSPPELQGVKSSSFWGRKCWGASSLAAGQVDGVSREGEIGAFGYGPSRCLFTGEGHQRLPAALTTPVIQHEHRVRLELQPQQQK